MVNVSGVPAQLPNFGVTVIVAVMGEEVAFTALKEAIFPEPVAAKPILGALLVQS